MNEESTLGNYFYGWYDKPDQPVNKPTYNPPDNAPCLFCGFAIIEGDVRTHSLMYLKEPKRSYFYRTHKSCAEKHGNLTMDGFILDLIARNEISS